MLIKFLIISLIAMPSNKLRWDDFRVITSSNGESANSATAIGYDYDGVSTVRIYCLFDKNKSFVLAGKQTDYLLNHEQGHFNITCLFANEFKRRLECEKELSENKIISIYNEVISEWNQLQNEYDNATVHSSNAEQQRLWDIKLKQL